MDPTDSTLIQSRVLQLQLSCLQIPPVYFKPGSTMRDREDSSMPEKTLRKGNETKHPWLLSLSVCLACVNVYLCVPTCAGRMAFHSSLNMVKKSRTSSQLR